MDSPSPQLEEKRAERNDDGPLLPDDVLALIAVSGDTALFATMALCSRALHSKLRSPHFIALARERLLREVWSHSRRERWHVNEVGEYHGTWEEWSDTGVRTHLSHWHEGGLHGTEEWWNTAGVRTYLKHWHEGKLHGTKKIWNSAGVRTHLSHWHEGKMHGTWEDRNDAGVRIKLLHWQEDELHGIYEEWNDAGVRIHLSHWNHGIEVRGAP